MDERRLGSWVLADVVLWRRNGSSRENVGLFACNGDTVAGRFQSSERNVATSLNIIDSFVLIVN